MSEILAAASSSETLPAAAGEKVEETRFSGRHVGVAEICAEEICAEDKKT